MPDCPVLIRTAGRGIVLTAALGLALSATPSPSAARLRGPIPVFPAAEGPGSTTPAGRGGTVYRVTNLDDSGSGSLRAAIDAFGPRVVIFEVSGTIRLASSLRIRYPDITIAGQTAPSPGITLRGAALRVEASDVLIQHLRVRVGDGSTENNPDGLSVMAGATSVVIDHNSFSWGIDENIGVSTVGDAARDITFSSNILSEGLSNSVHAEGEHSKGALINDRSRNVAFLRNLFAHNRERNPALKGDVSALIVNNVNYNPGNFRGSIYFSNSSDSTGPTIATVVGNVMIPGPDTPSPFKMIAVQDSAAAGSRIYVADNEGPGRTSDPLSVVDNGAGSRIVVTGRPIFLSRLIWMSPLRGVLPSSAVVADVLERAGARPADRDAVDRRIVTDVVNGTGRIIDSQRQVGGWPSLAANRRPLTLPSNPNDDNDRDGYTNLEEWLHTLSAAVEGGR